MDDPGTLTKHIIALRAKTPGGRFIVPFVNTIANLTKRGIEMTPVLGLALAKGQILPEVIAKQLEGALLSYILLQKLESGQMIGMKPKDKGKREAFERQGKQELSMKVGDRYVDMKVEPFHVPMAAIAIAHERMQDEPDEEKRTLIFTNLVNDIKNYLVDSAYLDGVAELAKDYRGKNTNPIEGFFKQLGASFVPYSSFMRTVAKTYESLAEEGVTVKEKDSWTDYFINTLPVANTKLDKKLNVWGQKIILEGNVFQQWLPYRTTKIKDDIVETGLEKLEIYPTVPDDTVRVENRDMKLDKDIYRDMSIRVGVDLYKAYGEIFKEKGMKQILEKVDDDINLKVEVVNSLKGISNKIKADYRNRAIEMQLARNRNRR